MAKNRRRYRYSQTESSLGYKQRKRIYETYSPSPYRSGIPHRSDSRRARDHWVAKQVVRATHYNYYKSYIDAYRRQKLASLVTRRIVKKSLPHVPFGGLLRKAARPLTRCKRAKNARRHEYFKSLHTGSSSGIRKHRKHRC